MLELVFHTPPLFDAHAQRNPSEFLGETSPAKVDGWASVL